MDHARTADGGGMGGGFVVSTRPTERKSRKRYQPPGIPYEEKEAGVDGSAQWERSHNERAN